MARLTPEILLSFSDLYLKSQFDEPVDTPIAHLEWWSYVCSPRRWVAIAAPRGHAKSTAITHTYVLANVCLRLKRHILIISDTEGQSAGFIGNIARELRENEDLKNTFGLRKILKDNETELILLWNDGAQTRIAGHGSGQKIRGTNWRNIRPDLIVCDDLENDELVMNEERREKFSNWFYKTLIPIGGKRADIRVVGTILHEDSLLNRLMPQPVYDDLCVDTGLRVTTTKETAFLGVLYRAHPDFDDFSELLWGDQHTEEDLRMVRQAYIDEGKPDGYAQEYLNNPIDKETAYFKAEDLLPILPEEKAHGHKSPETYYIGVDLAISEKARRAYSVFAVVGQDNEGKLRVREIIRKRIDSLDIIETFFMLHEKYKMKSAMREEPIFLVESENIAKALGPVLERDMEARGHFLIIEEMPPIRDKELRARSIQARIRAHMVEFDHEATWWSTLKHEMITFPKGTYDDQVDALAWVGYHVAKMMYTPTQHEIHDREYQDAYSAASFSWGRRGRSRITGY